MKIQIELSADQWHRLTGVKLDKLTDKYPELFDDGKAKDDADFSAVLLELEKEKTEDYGNRQWQRSRKALEGRLKKLGIEEFTKAEEGLDLLIEQQEAEQGKDPAAQLKDEDIRKHPVFKAAIAEEVTGLRTKLEATQSEFEKYKGEVAGKERHNAVQLAVSEQLEKLKAGYGAKGKQVALDRFFKAFPGIGINEKGNVLDANGEEVLHDHSPVKLEDFLRQEWDHGFNAAPDSPTPPPPTRKETGTGAYNITSADQYNEMIQRPNLTQTEKSGIRQGYAEFLEKQK